MEKMSATTNALNWFEIPVSNLENSRKFYESILQIDLFPMEVGGFSMIVFPCEPPKIGGALVKSPNHTPNKNGSIVYLNGNPDLQLVLDRVEAAGGKVITGKTMISPQIGFRGMFEDIDGNYIALHSNS
jgi:predicted enzyme related to lactoylglutathione lyase